MAKRFTDTNKWDHAWFRKLKPKMKVVWTYILDKCDHAGIWTSDFEALSFNVGEEITREEFEGSFGTKLQCVDDDKYLVKAFIAFQYGVLNPENRVHASVLSRLQKLAPNKDLISPLQGAKDKEKDKEKDKAKEKDQDKVLGKESVREKPFCKFDLGAAYQDYPRKEGKAEGFETLSKTILTEIQYRELCQAIRNYAEDCRLSNRERRYIRQFSSFIGPASKPYWRDWIDWTPESASKHNTRAKQTYDNLDTLEQEWKHKGGI